MTEQEYESEFAELPVSQAVKVIRRSQDPQGIPDLPDEELADWHEMQRVAHMRDWEPILRLPQTRRKVERAERYAEDGFDIEGLMEETEPEHVGDKLAEQVRDIAISHSCARDGESRERGERRFKYLVDTKVRSRALSLASRIRREGEEEKRQRMLGQLEELNQRIRKLNDIWREHSCWE